MQITRQASRRFGILFDIDGVLIRGKKVLPSAKEALLKLTDGHGEWRVPTVFVTNAGNSLRRHKAEKLSELFDMKIHSEQVIMSHSPMKLFKKYRQNLALISGQGPIREIANYLGFKSVITVDEVAAAYPHLDMMDHNKRREQPDLKFQKMLQTPVQSIMLFGEPVQWETSLQVTLDALLTNGCFDENPRHIPYPHLPVLACNKDLVWMADHSSPRLAHGSFLTCLETLYKSLTNRTLQFTAILGKPSELTYHYADRVINEQAQQMGIGPTTNLYAIGDNPDTDICGANLYHRHLQRQARKGYQNVLRQCGTISTVPSEEVSDGEDILLQEYASSCESVLVLTGVYSATNSLFQKSDFDPELTTPKHTVRNVLDAINMIFEKEKYA